MFYVVSVDSEGFKSYDNFADVMDYHLNGKKRCVLTYLEPHPFIHKYASTYGLTCKQISIDEIVKHFYLICFWLNDPLINKSKQLKLRKGIITEEIW